MRRTLLIGIVVFSAALGGWAYYHGVGPARAPIVVGLLHSRTGMFAATEKAMLDAEVMALEEINAAGGLLGRPLQWVIADGRSDGATFAAHAHRLITSDRVQILFGCYSSSCRKSVKPVVEETDHLLIYPAAYEGLEQSPNIVYTGGPANQQVFPALSWCLEHRKARKFFLIGSDTLWPHAVHELSKDYLKAFGGQVVGALYLRPGATDLADAVETLRKAAPDVVISAIEGDSNAPFYEQLRRAGVKADQLPVVSFSITEEDLRSLPPRDVVGHYAAWNYFQSIERAENQEFVRRFQARYGKDRVTCDSTSTAYNSVRLWAQAVAEAGTVDLATVRQVIRRQSLDAPEGIVSVDAQNLHNWRPFYLGKVSPDSQFEIVWSLTKPIFPVPYPTTRSKADWEAFVDDLYSGWGGHWVNPEPAAPARRGN